MTAFPPDLSSVVTDIETALASLNGFHEIESHYQSGSTASIVSAETNTGGVFICGGSLTATHATAGEINVTIPPMLVPAGKEIKWANGAGSTQVIFYWDGAANADAIYLTCKFQISASQIVLNYKVL